MTTTRENPSAAFLLGGDLPVARLGFGAMRLPAREIAGPANDPETSAAVLRRAVELGVNHIDTAWFYFHDGLSANGLIRRVLHPYPEDLVLAVKVGPVRHPDGSWGAPAGPRELVAGVHRTLRELGQDRLDLVYLRLHEHDEAVAERFGALAALREEGLIRHLGLSNTTTGQLASAQRIAPVAAVQNMYGLFHRRHPEVLDACTRQGIAFVPFFSLESLGRPEPAEPLARIAARNGASPEQVKLAWTLARSPVVLAIPGTSSVAHVEDNIAAAELLLEPEDLAALDAVST
ncbi:aldo/keto reductase [Streptomyces tanashiensis]|uniref:Aldo/keto reductase n=1 Tax=Streptomyces tanashiensis TaxID=67367 RepID=A0ABY6R1M7_9ACTN|nr:aldo/keto reductase [Streptomyces tanashiensis]UZX23088.1 aldo/keto reductase [Streptomyces tanashiensis]GGY30348.1 oxidoreductase [Streptomyces tanashiensis]